MSLTAQSEGMTWTKRRAMALIVVIVMHVWLLWLFWTKHNSQPVTPMETILVLLPIESNPTSSEKKQKHAHAPMPQDISSTDEQLAPQERTFHSPTAGVPHEEVANQIDWYAAAKQQAAKTAATPPTVREFGHSIPQHSPHAMEPSSVFTQPAHHFGDVTKTPYGDDIVWLSKNCYQVANSDANHFKSFATGMPDTEKNTVTCRKSFGQSQGNAHMFDFLKHPSAPLHPEQAAP